MYCNYQQDNWSDLLPLAKFAYNNAPSAMTGVSLFFANKGYHPNITVHPEHDLSPAQAREYTVNLELLHQYLHEEMAAAQKRYQGPTDARRSPAPDFKVGDQVYVKAKYFRSTRPSKKLSEKNLGPYPIITQVGTLSFTIHLPTLCMQSTPYSMSPSSILRCQTQYQISHNHRLHQSKLMANPSTRSPRSSTQN